MGFLRSQGKISVMPDINDNPISKDNKFKYTIRKAEEVQAVHK